MGMALMVQSLLASVQPLMILGFFLCIGVTLFSSLLYYAERLTCPDMTTITEAELRVHQQDCERTSYTWDSNENRCCDEYGSAIGFESIMDTAWLSIVTMTTVGYGDKAPVTKLGHLIGAVTMLSGIVLISLPVAIVGSKFQSAYEAAELETERRLFQERDKKEVEDAEAAAQLALKGESAAEEALGRMSTLVVEENKNMAQAAGQFQKDGASKSAHGTDEPANDKKDEDGRMGKAQLLVEHLRKLDRRTTLSGAAREQIKLIIALLEHISVTETKLLKLKEKDLAMEACISQEFATVCRQYDTIRRQVDASKPSKSHSSSSLASR